MLLAIGLFALLMGCSDHDDPATPVIKVGVAFDTGGRGDGTFNDTAAAGIDRAVAEFGVEVHEVEAIDSDGTPERLQRLRSLAVAGYNPIIAIGFAYRDALADLAAEFPQTTLAIVDAVVDAPNVGSLVFAEEQGSFLVGTLAASASSSGHIGFIGGMDIDLIRAFQAGFEQGARAVRPSIQIQVAYLGTDGDSSAWNAPERAQQAADLMIAQGVDIIYAAAGASGLGMHQAMAAAGGSAQGYWGIGVDADEYLLASRAPFKPNILTSMLKRVDVAVFDVIAGVVHGTPLVGLQNFDLQRQGVGYSLSNPAVTAWAPLADDYAERIKRGEIMVSRTPLSR